jgi:hypothetical protein
VTADYSGINNEYLINNGDDYHALGDGEAVKESLVNIKKHKIILEARGCRSSFETHLEQK